MPKPKNPKWPIGTKVFIYRDTRITGTTSLDTNKSVEIVDVHSFSPISLSEAPSDSYYCEQEVTPGYTIGEWMREEDIEGTERPLSYGGWQKAE